MAATLEAVPSMKTVEKLTEKSEAARELVRMAKEHGLALTGPDGLLKQLIKTVIETALNEELTEHLGYGRRDTAAKDIVTRATAFGPQEQLGDNSDQPFSKPNASLRIDRRLALCGELWAK
ncbi:hypothetical protein QFZ40_000423 [Arthrobacter pascens]|nr:hypothetical protein [Arthrobacter pascens]